MQNPLESEEAAFRFVLGTIVYFVPIVVAAWIATWLGVIVFVVMSVVAFLAIRRGTASEPAVVSTERAAVDDTRRILVVTDTMVVGPTLRAAILDRAAGVTEDVLLVFAVASSPAVGAGADTAALSRPEEPATALDELRSAGLNARSSVVASGALDALEDALRGYDADEVVISVASGAPTADAARSLFAGPVTAIVEPRVSM